MLTFRPAVSADIPALHALVESAYRGDSAKRGWTHEADLLGGQRTDPERLAEMLADPGQTILLAEDAADLAGCVAVERRIGYGYVGLVSVDPARQASGLGRALLEQAELLLVSEGVRLARMTVISIRQELVSWYERRGYSLTGETAPFPYGDERMGLPRHERLEFVVLEKDL